MSESEVSCALAELRPPAVGQEVTTFQEVPTCFSSARILNMELKDSKDIEDDPADAKETLDKSSSLGCSDAMRSDAEDNTEQSAYSSLHSADKWPKSLQYLLDDMQGIELFQRFLRQNGQDTRCLDFLFACRGVKKTVSTDSERLFKLVQVLYDKKVRRISAISEGTKQEIKQKILSRVGVNINIFDKAQSEVEMNIQKTTYPNFLNSDLYLQHVRACQGESLPAKECPTSPEELDCLPTLHEDSELHFSERQQLLVKKESFQRKYQRTNQISKTKFEIGALRSPYSVNYSAYHARYGSFQPTSAQDSELQSLSSDAQTDDTMSQTDSSVSYSASRNKHKRIQKNIYLNKDNLNHISVIPRTQLLHETDKFKNPQNNQEFHEQLFKKLTKVVEEQKVKEKISEKLKNIEACEYPRQDAVGCSAQKSSKQMFDPNFLLQTDYPKPQDILDMHVSRVFNDLGQTPVLSPVCASPPVARPTNEAFSHLPVCSPVIQESHYSGSHKIGQNPPFSIIANAKHKREHDTRSCDSGAITEWLSEDNLTAQSQQSSGVFKQAPTNLHFLKDQSRKSCRRSGCSVNDSSSSCVDSGISEVCEPVLPSHSNLKTMYHSGEGTSDATHNYASSISRTALVPAQPLAQDPSMPALPIPDTTTNLIEARRRLVDDGKIKMPKSRYVFGVTKARQPSRSTDSFEDGICHRKQSKKCLPSALDNSLSNSQSETTVIGYSYGQGAVPYLTRYHGKNITLKIFKSLLTKKGNFKYYFRKVENTFGTGTVLEEVSDDHTVLPLWEGKVFCVIESVDDVSSTED